MRVISSSLEACRIDDGIFAKAYDAASPACRAMIKTAIALAFHHFPSYPDKESKTAIAGRMGFSTTYCSQPADAAIIVCDSGPGAAQITAAAMLPVIAGVADITAIHIGPPSAQFLLSMELCGIEECFQLNANAICEFMAQCCNEDSKIRRILTICHHRSLCNNIAIKNSRSRIAAGDFAAKIALDQARGEFVDLLPFMLGDQAEIVEDESNANVIYRGAGASAQKIMDHPQLSLGAGCEGFWLFPGLDPDFFRVFSRSFTLL